MTPAPFRAESHGPPAAAHRARTERARADPVTTHVVLGHRRGPQGRTVLHHGADLAGRLGAALHVVHAVDLSDHPVDPDAADWEEQAQEALAAEQQEVESFLADLPGPWTYRTGRGDPVALLRRVADHYDALLIVVGSRGEGAGSVVSRLLGPSPSVSHGLIARTHRPVLVVPLHAAAGR
ncbi:universal stress protein [Actinomycetospora lutea]|uniref:universal stress protein n=1 Tax=Actinomycetospora lutea TaxID=663604 RepID=UPI002366EF0E|nr:universal stress protein [Actinomycetospora lutea]MDD7939607.1 universal stress protein [Actinomycetospora lutea]